MTIYRLLVLFILFFPVQVLSQGVQFGVDWKIPESIPEQEQQLKQYKDFGFSVIQIEGVVDQSTIELIQTYGFNLWISSGIKFLRPSDFPDQQNLVDRLTDPLFYYRNNGISFERYILLEHPLKTVSFLSELKDFIAETEGVYTGEVNLLISDQDFEIIVNEIGLGLTLNSFDTTTVNALPLESIDYFHVLNSAFNLNSAREFRNIFANSNLKDKTWFFESKIIETLDSSPDLAKILKGFSLNNNAVIALGPEIAEEDTLVVITITILILITLFIAIFSTNASYQRSIIRYLLTHNFFINDVMMKRTRITGALPLSWLLSLLFGVLFIWIAFDSIFNEVTIDMLQYHHPYLGSILSGGVSSVITYSTIGLILLQLVSFFWITASTFGKSSMAQVAQILLVPHQLIIPLTIIVSLFYLNSNSPMILFYSFWLFFAIMLISIPMTCIDILSQSQGKKSINWVLGPISFVLVMVGLLIYILHYTSIPDTVSLILALI